MKIPSGEYLIGERNLQLHLSDDLDLSPGAGCVFLKGGNGLGKTTFLEKIVVPALASCGAPYVFLGQDIRTQIYTLKALLAVVGQKGLEAGEAEIFRRFLACSRSARIVLLDEFDKYFPEYPTLFDWPDSSPRSYLIVSHADSERLPAAEGSLPVQRLRFEPIGVDGPLKKVRVQRETPWR
jgi:hypothetical protein